MYYNKIMNHGLEDQNYFSNVGSGKKKISIAKARTNSHEL
jgi:hypothetical protein